MCALLLYLDERLVVQLEAAPNLQPGVYILHNSQEKGGKIAEKIEGKIQPFRAREKEGKRGEISEKIEEKRGKGRTKMIKE